MPEGDDDETEDYPGECRCVILFPLKLRLPLRHGPKWIEEVALASESANSIERWKAQRRMTVLASLLKGEARADHR